jgi:hypothetical protein
VIEGRLAARLARVARRVAFAEPPLPEDTLAPDEADRVREVAQRVREGGDALDETAQAALMAPVMPILARTAAARSARAAWLERVRLLLAARDRFPAFSLQMQERARCLVEEAARGPVPVCAGAGVP